MKSSAGPGHSWDYSRQCRMIEFALPLPEIDFERRRRRCAQRRFALGPSTFSSLSNIGLSPFCTERAYNFKLLHLLLSVGETWKPGQQFLKASVIIHPKTRGASFSIKRKSFLSPRTYLYFFSSSVSYLNVTETKTL